MKERPLNERFIDNYSGMKSIEQINKRYDAIAENKGNIAKIHNIVMDDIIGKIEGQEFVHSGVRSLRDDAANYRGRRVYGRCPSYGKGL